MSNNNNHPETLSNALATLGGIVGFLWGGTFWAEVEDNFLVGALVGVLMGVVGGKILGVVVSVAIRMAIAVGSILATLLWFYVRAGGGLDS